jgi:hypothetical protein
MIQFRRSTRRGTPHALFTLVTKCTRVPAMQVRESVFFEIGPDQLIEGMLTAMAAEPAGSPRELFFYEAALSLSYQATDSQGAFARVYEVADKQL